MLQIAGFRAFEGSKTNTVVPLFIEGNMPIGTEGMFEKRSNNRSNVQNKYCSQFGPNLAEWGWLANLRRALFSQCSLQGCMCRPVLGVAVLQGLGTWSVCGHAPVLSCTCNLFSAGVLLRLIEMKVLT